MPLHIISGDIFSLKNKVDAFVVPANKKPVAGYGLDSKMFKAAGFKRVMEQRKEMGMLHLGQAKETDGFELARYLIHTASPMWLGGTSGECEKLKSCYINSIKCADRLGLKSIDFPLLSSGNMKFPLGTAYETAVNAINERLSVHDSLNVYLVKFEGDEQEKFIKAETVYGYRDDSIEKLEQCRAELSAIVHPDTEAVWYLTNITTCISIKAQQEAQQKSLEAALPKYLAENPGKSCEDIKRERFYEYFDSCKKTASKLAELIGCNKATVSRIKNGQTKFPQKKTVIALAIAMELPMKQRFDFINCSGHAYPADKMDYAVEQLMHDGYKSLSNISDMLYEKNKEWLLVGTNSDELSEKSEHSISRDL